MVRQSGAPVAPMTAPRACLGASGVLAARASVVLLRERKWSTSRPATRSRSPTSGSTPTRRWTSSTPIARSTLACAPIRPSKPGSCRPGRRVTVWHIQIAQHVSPLCHHQMLRVLVPIPWSIGPGCRGVCRNLRRPRGAHSGCRRRAGGEFGPPACA
jgi:hypothetical protein